MKDINYIDQLVKPELIRDHQLSAETIDLYTEGFENTVFVQKGVNALQKYISEEQLLKVTELVDANFSIVTNFDTAKQLLRALSGRPIPSEYANNAINIANHFARLRRLWEQGLERDPAQLILTSVYRDAAANAATGRGAPKSYHLIADALDIAVAGNKEADRIALLLVSALASHNGYHSVYESHVHTDNHPRSRPIIATCYKTVPQLGVVSKQIEQVAIQTFKMKKNANR